MSPPVFGTDPFAAASASGMLGRRSPSSLTRKRSISELASLSAADLKASYRVASDEVRPPQDVQALSDLGLVSHPDGSMRIGNLILPQPTAERTFRGIEHLTAENPEGYTEGLALVAALARSPRPCAIVADASVPSSYDPTARRVIWNDEFALHDPASDTTHEPLGGLDASIAHAALHAQNPDLFDRLRQAKYSPRSKVGDALGAPPTLEEKRVFEGPERRFRAARKLPARTSFSGRTFPVRSMTERKPSFRMIVNGEERRLESGHVAGEVLAVDRERLTLQTENGPVVLRTPDVASVGGTLDHAVAYFDGLRRENRAFMVSVNDRGTVDFFEPGRPPEQRQT